MVDNRGKLVDKGKGKAKLEEGGNEDKKKKKKKKKKESFDC